MDSRATTSRWLTCVKQDWEEKRIGTGGASHWLHVPAALPLIPVTKIVRFLAGDVGGEAAHLAHLAHLSGAKSAHVGSKNHDTPNATRGPAGGAQRPMARCVRVHHGRGRAFVQRIPQGTEHRRDSRHGQVPKAAGREGGPCKKGKGTDHWYALQGKSMFWGRVGANSVAVSNHISVYVGSPRLWPRS